FSVVQDVFGGITLLRRARNGRSGSVNQAAQQCLVADYLYVMLNARPVRDAIEQSGDVSRAADGFEFGMTAEFLGQRNQVDGPRRLGEIDHARVNAAVRVEEKVFGLKVLGGLIISKIVEQHRPENRAFSFNVRGQA